MTRAWEKLHLAVLMLNKDGDRRYILADAYASEICHIDEDDIPLSIKNQFEELSKKLSLPDNVETLSGYGHPLTALKRLSDQEVESLIQSVYEMYEILNKEHKNET